MSTEPGRIVVGVDGSPSSISAVRWALDEARRRHANVELLTCWRPPMTADASGFGTASIDPVDLAAPSTDRLERVVAQLDEEIEAHRRLGLRVTTRVLEGPSGPTLVDESKEALALVVGRRGHSRLAHLLLGSTSRYVVMHATCPVTVLPDPEVA